MMMQRERNFCRGAWRCLGVLLGRPWLIVLGGGACLALLCLQFTPLVEMRVPPAQAEPVRVEGSLLASVPASPGVAGPHELRWNEEELNLLARELLSLLRLSPPWAARLHLREGALDFAVSRSLAGGGLPYLNLRGMIVSDGRRSQLHSLWVGAMPVPRLVLGWLTPQFPAETDAGQPLHAEIGRLLANVTSLQLGADEIRVGMNWEPQLLGRIGAQARRWLISESDRQRIVEYHAVIRQTADQAAASERAIPLGRLLAPLFAEARRKSLQGSDPIAENQALLQTLAADVNEEDIAQLIGAEAAAAVAPAKFIEVRLQRRQDLAQHLSSVAAITVALGPELALLLSTAKESYDARHRSGFSFSDLTANSVGVTLARVATRDRESALEIQRRMSELDSDADFMPRVGGNRDGLSEDDFSELYQNTGSEAYRQKVAELQLLIESGPIFAGL